MPRVETSAKRFQILADPIRLRIILLLLDGEKCVGELTESLKLSQPKVSYHLKLMHSESLVNRRCEGTWCYYSLTTDIRQWVQFEFDSLLENQANSL